MLLTNRDSRHPIEGNNKIGAFEGAGLERAKTDTSRSSVLISSISVLIVISGRSIA